MSKNTKKDFIYSRCPEKQNKPKKNKTAMIILWLLFAFWTLSSVLSVFVFTKQVVKADTITELYTFQGSNITVWGSPADFGIYDDKGTQDYYDNTWESIPFDTNLWQPNVYPIIQKSNSLVNYQFTISDIDWERDGVTHATELIFNSAYIQYSSEPLVANRYINSYNVDTLEDGNQRIILGGDNNLVSYYIMYSASRNLNAQYLRISRSSVNFYCNIYKIDIGNYQGTLSDMIQTWSGPNGEPAYYLGSETVNFNYIRYYDVNEEYIEFAWPVSASNSYKPQAFFSDRTYYLSNAFSSATEYRIGYKQGHSDGYRSGYNTGLSSSYDKGYQAGYDSGFNSGLASTEQYSFLNLMGAVVDAPIRALFGWVDGSGQVVNGLLNFNVLGVNIANLVAGLLTIGLVVAILRICMGKS